MERSNTQELNNYTLLSKYYDYLLSDVESFSYWLKYIESKPFNTCLELASGSGILTSILKKKGYEIIGSDISKEMKNVSKSNFDGDYLILDMANYHLNKKFDLVLCVCDSFNYLSYKDLKSFFLCAKEHLNDNGRLIFDMHSVKRLEEFKEEYVEEGELFDSNYYQWTILADPIESTLNECFTFYIKDGIIQEHHTQYVYEVDLIKSLMTECGFNTKIIKDFIKDEKELLIGEL